MRGEQLQKWIIDIIYPRRCPICGDIVTPRGELSCPACRKNLVWIEEPRCKKCSKPIDSHEVEYCYDCERKHHHYQKGFALWVYDKQMQKSIADFKFKGRREYSDFYIAELVRGFGDAIRQLKPDVLIPVPIHKHKKLQRGYNQAEIVAKGIGKELNIPVLTELLQRDKNTLPQKQLNDKERLKNLEKAFKFSNEEYEKYRNILYKVIIVDDIYTTGSTIEACTNILMQNGIAEVYFVSICIGKGY
jgi:ComF family protein